MVLAVTVRVSDMTLGHTLWNVAPILPGGWVYLGEKDKIVAASGRRLRSWNSTATTLILTLLAAVSCARVPRVSHRALGPLLCCTSTPSDVVCVALPMLASQPHEMLSVAVLPPGERDTATIVQCVSGPGTVGSSSTIEAPNAYGDVDVVVSVKCVHDGHDDVNEPAGVPDCKC